MNNFWNDIIWQQFGAAIDMLGHAVNVCPDEQWRDAVWDEPTDDPSYTEFWFIAYHALAWLDRFLSADAPQSFELPAPFVAGKLPDQPYSKADLQTYLAHCRQKCHTTLADLTVEKARQPCQFPWGEEVSYAELQLYSLRHVQEHASQLSLHLGKTGTTALDWIAQAEG